MFVSPGSRAGRRRPAIARYPEYAGAPAPTDLLQVLLGTTEYKTQIQNFLKVLNALAADGAPDAAADYVMTYDASAGVVKKVLLNLIGSADFKVLETKNGSGVASYDFTTGIDGTYRTHLIVGHLIPANDAATLWARTDANGGASFDAGATDYKWTARGFANTGLDGNSGGDSKIKITQDGGSPATYQVGNGAAEGVEFAIRLHSPSVAALKGKLGFEANWYAAGDFACWAGGTGIRDAAGVINAAQLLFDAGNIASGLAVSIGIK